MRVKFKLLRSGFCQHLEYIALRTGKLKICQFPALFALIIHPNHGLILYDTGYASGFYKYTRHFPERFYRMFIPVYCRENETAAAQLTALGYRIEDVRYILLSHFHADHISGLRDFPNAQFICSRVAYGSLLTMGKLRAVLHGFIHGLLPINFSVRCSYVENYPRIDLDSTLLPFTQGFDLFSDGSLLAIELPGHVEGQLGLILREESGRQIFLIADACWLSRSYEEFILPHPFTRIVTSNWGEYQQTLWKLHQLYRSNSDIVLIPSHCQKAAGIFQIQDKHHD